MDFQKNVNLKYPSKNKVSFFVSTRINIIIYTNKSIKYNVMGDRIEAGTFCIAASLTKGNLIIKNFNPRVIATEISLLKKLHLTI